MSSPYVTPAMLQSAPTGVPWNIIPFPKATSEQQEAEQMNICWRATGRVDGFCNQPLRATLDTEQVHGPDYRLTVDPSGVGRALASRWPVLDVVGAQLSPQASIPRQWQVIPADAIVPESPPMGVYGSSGFGAAADGGSAVLVAPGYVSWAAGRRGYVLEMYYLNGWPHAGLTAAAVAGATTLQVDDVTGYAGAQAFIYDGASTEMVQVESVTALSQVTVPGGALVPVGPGTVTLVNPTQYAHAAQVIVSGLPQVVLWATVLYAAVQVLQSGATAVTIQNIPGSKSTGGAGIRQLIEDVEGNPATKKPGLLSPFVRVI